MELCKENFIVYASRFYTNENCSSFEEFQTDLEQSRLAKKLAKKISQGRSTNIRLLCNHIQCFTNNFELNAAKTLLIFDTTEEEKKALKTVLHYFGFLSDKEMVDIKYCLNTAKALKEMDK